MKNHSLRSKKFTQDAKYFSSILSPCSDVIIKKIISEEVKIDLITNEEPITPLRIQI